MELPFALGQLRMNMDLRSNSLSLSNILLFPMAEFPIPPFAWLFPKVNIVWWNIKIMSCRYFFGLTFFPKRSIFSFCLFFFSKEKEEFKKIYAVFASFQMKRRRNTACQRLELKMEHFELNYSSLKMRCWSNFKAVEMSLPHQLISDWLKKMALRIGYFTGRNSWTGRAI